MTMGFFKQNTIQSKETKRVMNLHHTHKAKPNQCTSILVQPINAPISTVWSLLRRFDQPHSYKRFIKNCTMVKGSGNTVGSIREVEIVSGLPAEMSRERLDHLDDDMHVMSYTMIGGDHRLLNYKSTATVHEVEDGGGVVLVESYLVDVPKGNTEDETRYFVNTIVGCNHESLANVAENLACNMQ